MINAGSHIKSTAALDGTFFENTVILIVRNNSDGATGFIMNKPYGRFLNDLEEFKNSKPFPLLEGGPVDPEHVYVLHKRPDLIKESQQLNNGLYVGGAIEEVVEAINANKVTGQDLKLFIGYCGWDAEELEGEMEEGSWIMVDSPSDF